jgi:DNA-binding transcriptional MerR regulator
MLLKIGQLARQTGLTVRTLHHYDAIGLLRPSGRADNGYRLYDRTDIARLHQIQALRRLDLGLEAIGALLATPDADIATVVARQVEQLNAQIANATLLRDRLLRLQDDFAAQAEPDLQEWLTTLELMAIFDKHLTPEETARWHTHNRKSRAEIDAWKALVTDTRALMQADVPPDAAPALACVRRWLELTDPHLKRSPRLMLKMDVLYRQDPALQAAVGTDAALIDYVSRAGLHYRLDQYARHLEPAQLAAIRPRFLRQSGNAWTALGHDVRVLMEDGAPVDSPAVAAVCARWRKLLSEWFGDDPQIRARVLHAQATDPEITRGSGWSPDLSTFLKTALAHIALGALSDTAEAGHA